MGLFSKIKSYIERGTESDNIGLLFNSNGGSSKYQKESFLTAYESSIYINKALEKRATKVGQVEFILKQGDKVIDNNPVLDTLNKPNSYQTKKKFIATWQKYKDIFGEVYVWVKPEQDVPFAKSKKSLHILYTPNVKRKYDEAGEITGYEINSNGKISFYKKEEIIYDNRPNPKDPRKGISLLEAGMNIYALSRELEDLQLSIAKNGGRLETVINFKDRARLTGTQVDDMTLKYGERYEHARRTGQPMFLGGDVAVQNLGLTPNELGFLEGRKMTLNDICILTEVPKPLLASAEDSTYNNAETALRIFLRETIKPEQEQIAEVINQSGALVPDNLELTIIDPTPEDNEMKLKAIENGIKNYWLTPNEAREKMGLDPITNGDEILLPFSLGTLNQVNEKPEETSPSEPNADEGKKKNIIHPLENKEFRAEYHKRFIKRADKHELVFKRRFNLYLMGQRERLVEKLNKYTRSYTKANLDDVFNEQFEIRIGIKELLPMIFDIARESGQSALELVGFDGTFRVTTELEHWLEKKAEFFLTEVTNTTKKQLQKQFNESFEANESFGQLADRVKETYKGISTGRSFTIARTETNGVMNKSQLEGYQQAGMRIKVWVAVMDGHTRDSHASLDGQVKPMNTPFSNGLMFPSDPNGSAGETINCRCSI